jgi:hypothetical protein
VRRSASGRQHTQNSIAKSTIDSLPLGRVLAVVEAGFAGWGAVYPAQILTDVVDGEIVGLTAVYDKSVSTQELQTAVDALYSKSKVVLGSKLFVWRVEPEQLAIQLSGKADGAKQVTFLKFVKYGGLCALVPSAHIDPSAKNDWENSCR